MPSPFKAFRISQTGDTISGAVVDATLDELTPQGDAALIDTVADALGGQRLLLVVDNCEHVLGAARSAAAA